MKSFAGLVTLGFARKMVVEKPVEVVQTRDPLAFTIKPVFDFSSYAEAGKTCDIRMGTTLSLIDCGTSFSTFDTRRCGHWRTEHSHGKVRSHILIPAAIWKRRRSPGLAIC